MPKKIIVIKKTPVKKTKKSRTLTDAAILDAFSQLSAAIVNLTNEVKDMRGTEEEPVEEAAEPPAVRRADGKMVSAKVLTGKEQSKAPVKATVSEIKARYELWAYDEYNQGSIVNAGPRLDKVIEAARRFVSEQNVDNALAAGEKDKAWEAYFPEIFVGGEPSTDVLYAGNKRDGKHYVYVRGENKWELRRPDASVQFRFYLGTTSNGRVKSDWYLKNHKGQDITSITDQALERKTALFVKVI